MSKAVAVNTGKVVPLKPWGEANPLRGLMHMDHAVAFAKMFPIGSNLSVSEWDDFLSMRGLLTIPNSGQGSDAWMAHVLRRNRVRQYVNQAAQHPNIHIYGAQPYRIDLVGRPNQHKHDSYIVKGVFDVVIADEIGRYIKSRINHKRKQLDIALQGVDLNELSPIEKHTVEYAHRRGDGLAEIIRFHTQQYLNEMTLATKIVLSIKTKGSASTLLAEPPR
jgi:hypothetical protein